MYPSSGVSSHVPQSLLIIFSSLMYLFFPLSSTASLPFCLWKRSFPSTSTPKLCIPSLTQKCTHSFSTWMTMLYRSCFFTYSQYLYVFSTWNFCHLFLVSQHPILYLFSTVFSLLVDFFHKHNWGSNKAIQCNYHLTWGWISQTSNPPVHNSKPKVKFSFQINWHGFVDIKPENLGLY